MTVARLLKETVDTDFMPMTLGRLYTNIFLISNCLSKLPKDKKSENKNEDKE
jgi:hypothetical protein